MGNCQRRNTNMQDPPQEDDIWHLVDNIPVIDPVIDQVPRNRRFIKAVRRIKTLLILRRIYARAGHYFDTANSRLPENTRLRMLMKSIFTTWPRTVLRRTAIIFNHVKRENGRLVYK